MWRFFTLLSFLFFFSLSCTTHHLDYMDRGYRIAFTVQGLSEKISPSHITLTDDLGNVLPIEYSQGQYRASHMYGGSQKKVYFLNLILVSADPKPEYPQWFKIAIEKGEKKVEKKITLSDFEKVDTPSGVWKKWKGKIPFLSDQSKEK